MSLPSERDLGLLADRVDGLSELDRGVLFRGLVDAAKDRASTDGLFWLRFVLTRDEADSARSVKPFPLHLEYLRELWGVLADQQCVVVAKSRQMLVSWAVAAYCVWTARNRANSAVFWQS